MIKELFEPVVPSLLTSFTVFGVLYYFHTKSDDKWSSLKTDGDNKWSSLKTESDNRWERLKTENDARWSNLKTEGDERWTKLKTETDDRWASLLIAFTDFKNVTVTKFNEIDIKLNNLQKGNDDKSH